MSNLKVSPEAKAYIDKLKLRVQQLTAENEELRFQIQARPRDVATMKVRTIQATSKIWKLFILIGGLLLLTGVPSLMIGIGDDRQGAVVYGVFAMFFGVLLWILGKFGKFWFHE